MLLRARIRRWRDEERARGGSVEVTTALRMIDLQGRVELDLPQLHIACLEVFTITKNKILFLYFVCLLFKFSFVDSFFPQSALVEPTPTSPLSLEVYSTFVFLSIRFTYFFSIYFPSSSLYSPFSLKDLRLTPIV